MTDVTDDASVTLRWQAANAFRGGSGVGGHDVSGSGTLLDPTPSLVDTDSNVDIATTHQYAARVRNNSGNVSVSSTPVSATTLTGDTCSKPPRRPLLSL